MTRVTKRLREYFQLHTVAMLMLVVPTGISAQAQEASAPEAAPSTECALHIWPGSPLRSTFYGWLHGGIVDGSVNGRAGYPKLPSAPLDTATQKAVLEKLDPATLLGLPSYKVTVHGETLDSRTLRNTPGRYTAEGGPCHAELAIDDVFFQEDAFSGRYLKVIYRFKRFDGGETPARSFGAIATEKLTLFPPPKPDDDPQPALDELRQAFAHSVETFGKQLTAPPRKKH